MKDSWTPNNLAISGLVLTPRSTGSTIRFRRSNEYAIALLKAISSTHSTATRCMLQSLWRGLRYGYGALADFNRAIALDPRSAWAYFGRGTILGEQGRFDEAIADFDRAVELDPQFALAYANRGLARLRRGEDYMA